MAGTRAQSRTILHHHNFRYGHGYLGSIYCEGATSFDYVRAGAAGWEPQQCGDAGTVYLGGDLNEDCYLDLADFSALAVEWLHCTDPAETECDPYWEYQYP